MKETGRLSCVFFEDVCLLTTTTERSELYMWRFVCLWGGGEPVQNYTLFSALSIVCKATSTTWPLESLRLCARYLRYMVLCLNDVISPMIKWHSNMMMVFCRTMDMLVQFRSGLFFLSKVSSNIEPQTLEWLSWFFVLPWHYHIPVTWSAPLLIPYLSTVYFARDCIMQNLKKFSSVLKHQKCPQNGRCCGIWYSSWRWHGCNI